MLIPVAFAAWWVLTKRTFNRVRRDLARARCLTDCGEVLDNSCAADIVFTQAEDQFQTWGEVLVNETMDTNVQFVRWVRGRPEPPLKCPDQGLRGHTRDASILQSILENEDEKQADSWEHLSMQGVDLRASACTYDSISDSSIQSVELRIVLPDD